MRRPSEVVQLETPWPQGRSSLESSDTEELAAEEVAEADTLGEMVGAVVAESGTVYVVRMSMGALLEMPAERPIEISGDQASVTAEAESVMVELSIEEVVVGA